MNTLYENMIRFRTKNLHEDSKDGEWSRWDTIKFVTLNTIRIVKLFKAFERYPDQKYKKLKNQGYKLGYVSQGRMSPNPVINNIKTFSLNYDADQLRKYYMYKGDQKTTNDIVPIPQMYYTDKSRTKPLTKNDYINYINNVKKQAQDLVQANGGIAETEFALRNILQNANSIKGTIRGALNDDPAPLNKKVVTTIANTVASSPKVANEFVKQIVQLAKDVGVKVT